MSSFCLKCKNKQTNKKNKQKKTSTENINLTNNSGTIILSKCAMCGSKKSRFINKN